LAAKLVKESERGSGRMVKIILKPIFGWKYKIKARERIDNNSQ
jgi:hypothetical protein